MNEWMKIFQFFKQLIFKFHLRVWSNRAWAKSWHCFRRACGSGWIDFSKVLANLYQVYFVDASLITVSVLLWIAICAIVVKRSWSRNSECARFLTNLKSLENTLRQLSLNYSQSNHRGELSNNSSNYFQPFLTFSFPKEYISQIAAVRSHLELIGPISFLCEAETRT